MTITLSKKIGLIAGDGELPIVLARSAAQSGIEVVAVSLSSDNRKALKKYCSQVYSHGAGEIQKTLDILHKEKITQITFIGKVSKGMLFRNPKLDKRAFKLLSQIRRLNDDALMLTAVNELEKENITVLDQSIFLKELLATKGVMGIHLPTPEQESDIEYGFEIAKQMGKIDIGQTVVVQNKMILAVEAIEGTDRAVERGCKLGKQGSVVVKVSKPNQDKRFDIPTAGVNTLKTMKKFGASVLAIEANETFIVQRDEMIEFADKNKMVIIAV